MDAGRNPTPFHNRDHSQMGLAGVIPGGKDPTAGRLPCLFIPDNPPTGTKDQIVLLCSGHFLDGLCYYTEGNDHFDNDEQQMREFGWNGDPILGKYGAKRYGEGGAYEDALAATSWDTGANPSPASKN